MLTKSTVLVVLSLLLSFAIKAEEKDTPGQEFLHFGNMGGLLPTLEIDDLPESDSNGAKMIMYFCSQCHNPPGPGLHTEEQWNHVYWKMYWRMHLMKAQFKSFKVPKYDEGEVMFAYLKKHAMRSVKAASIDKREEGASEYMRTCMQCHDLPRPDIHKKEDWHDVVKRLQKHMKSMSRISPSPEETLLILKYLKNRAKQP